MASVFRQFPDDTLAIYDVEGDETLACVEDVVGEQVPVVVSEFWEVVLDLEVNDAVHAQSVDNLTLTIVETLSVQDAVHAQSVDSLTLTIVETLSVQDATHEQSVENVTLITQTFAVADATHALSSDNVVLEQVIYKLIDAIVERPGARCVRPAGEAGSEPREDAVIRRVAAFFGIASLALVVALVVGNWMPAKPAPRPPDLRVVALAESLTTARAEARANLDAWMIALQDRDTVIQRVVRYVVRRRSSE